MLNSIKNKKKRLDKIMGCQIDILPTKYLGMPLFEGRLRTKYWDNLLEKIKYKLVG